MTLLHHTAAPSVTHVVGQHGETSLYLFLGGAAIGLLLSLISCAARRGARRRFNTALQAVFETMRMGTSQQKTADGLLGAISCVVHAPTLAFYLRSGEGRPFRLVAARFSTVALPEIEPSYSGMIPYRKEQFSPPPLYRESPCREGMTRIAEGEVSCYTLAVNDRAFVLMAPMRKLSPSDRKMLIALSPAMSGATRALEMEMEFEEQRQVMASSVVALDEISRMVSSPDAILRALLSNSVEASTAIGTVFLPASSIDMSPVTIGFHEEAVHEMVDNPASVLRCVEPIAILNQGDPLFLEVPESMVALGADSFLCLRTGGGFGWLCYGFQSELTPENPIVRHLQRTASDVGAIVQASLDVTGYKEAYLQLLTRVAIAIDNASPFTVGRSEETAKLARETAKRLGIPDVDDIELAARLSNVGVLGVAAAVAHKHGRYSDADYEAMKAHARVGAALVRMSGNEKLASYILHHHERMDGNGYPMGLQGSEIPMGARIISAVQVFLARISGRPNRSPLSFDKAVDSLRSASGSQLDPEVVDALTSLLVEGK